MEEGGGKLTVAVGAFLLRLGHPAWAVSLHHTGPKGGREPIPGIDAGWRSLLRSNRPSKAWVAAAGEIAADSGNRS